MKNYTRYLFGALAGMIAEYLYRVEFYIVPFIILVLIVIIILIDLFKSHNDKIQIKYDQNQRV